jgi:ribosome-binding factor A
MTRRNERVNELLRRVLSQVILRELRDPRLGGLVTLTEVQTSPDLQLAQIYVSVMGSTEEQDGVLEALYSATGYLRRTLRSRMSLKQIPELRFIPDNSIERGHQLLELIDRVSNPQTHREGR